MGGIVSLAFRLKDGTIKKSTRHTNIMPHWINNLDLIENPEKVAAEMMAEFEVLQAEAAAGEDSWRAYIGGHEGLLAPREYGLVLVDLRDSKIRHMQGYANFGQVYLASLNIERFGCSILPNHPDSRTVQAKRLYDAGKITRLRWPTCPPVVGQRADRYVWEDRSRQYGKVVGIEDGVATFAVNRIIGGHGEVPGVEPFTIRVPVEEIDGPLVENFSEDFTWEDIISGELSQRAEGGDLLIDMAPFEIVRYDDTPDGAREFKEALVEAGFKFTSAEDEQWAAWISRFEEDESLVGEASPQ